MVTPVVQSYVNFIPYCQIVAVRLLKLQCDLSTPGTDVWALAM